MIEETPIVIMEQVIKIAKGYNPDQLTPNSHKSEPSNEI